MGGPNHVSGTKVRIPFSPVVRLDHDLTPPASR